MKIEGRCEHGVWSEDFCYQCKPSPASREMTPEESAKHREAFDAVLASRAATAAGEELAVLYCRVNWGIEKGHPSFDGLSHAYTCGHASATKGLRERLEGVANRLESLALYSSQPNAANAALATLREILGELKE